MAGKRDPAAETAEAEPGPTVKVGGASKTRPTTAPTTLDGILHKYRLESELGVGGMGVVYAAFDPDLERRVALKVLHAANMGREARERLLREARAMARLSHPNVVRVYEVGSADDRDFVAMELIDGTTLAEWLRDANPAPAQIIAAFVAAGRGLAAAHAAGIVHRDFKPHNVLRRHDGLIEVSDFGVARDVVETLDTTASLETTASRTPASRNTPSPLSGLTEAGSVVGTPAYMAPEQWLGQPVGPAADQYAFCVALWEALVGSRPFRGSVDEIRAGILRGPDELDASKLPRRVRSAILRGLEPDPGQRWPSMDALLGTLERSRRRLALPVALGAGAILALAMLVWGTRHAPDWKPDIHKLEPDYDENATAPAISPDGKRLAFVSDRLNPQHASSVFVMPIEGGPATRIDVQTLDDIDLVRWSRDGEALLLLRVPRLIRHPLDGSPETTIATDVDDVDDCADTLAIISTEKTVDLVLLEPDGRRHALAAGDARMNRPRCTGQRVVYVRIKNLVDHSTTPVDGAFGDLWIVDRQGHRERLTDDGTATDPSFTPDARSIVFARHDRDGVHLYERVLASGALHQLTFGGGPDLGPSVSPDGHTLVFNRDTSSTEIRVGVVDGQSARVVTPRCTFAGLQPTRDGRRLVGMRFDLDGTHVVSIDTESGHQTDLGPGEDAFVSADDRRVYFHSATQPNTLYATALDTGRSELVATFPGPIVRGIATADGPHVVLSSDGVRTGWSVEGGRAVDEHATGLVIPAPSGPWRAVVRDEHVELSAPGQPVRVLACDVGLGAWLDDHRFACATDEHHVATLDAITNDTAPLFTSPQIMDDLRIVVAQGIRWAATSTRGEATRFAITNFDERPWKP